jgi:transposase-like protein
MVRGAAAMKAKGGIPRGRLTELVEQGLTIREIGRAVDRSPTTVRYWLDRYGLYTSLAARRQLPRTLPRTILRCRIHGEQEHVRRSDGFWRCIPCRSECVSRSRQRSKATLVAEAGGCCVLCGYNRCLGALEFHHVDPSTKLFGVSAHGLARSMADLRAEVAKCILLCSNCHVEVEMGVRPLVA